MIVCVCHRVPDRDIARAAQRTGSFEEMQRELKVGTCCGRCLDCAREVFDEARAGHLAHAVVPTACEPLPVRTIALRRAA